MATQEAQMKIKQVLKKEKKREVSSFKEKLDEMGNGDFCHPARLTICVSRGFTLRLFIVLLKPLQNYISGFL